MMDRDEHRTVPPRPAGVHRRLVEWFAFRPWMLAAAVLLACALGVAVMEELRSPREMWAQVTPAQR